MLGDLYLSLTVPVGASLYGLGMQAKAQGRPDMQAQCDAILGAVGGTVEIRVGAREFFVAAVQQARESGNRKQAAALESVLQALKAGRHLEILGSFNVAAGSTPGEIEGQAETLARRVIAARGG